MNTPEIRFGEYLRARRDLLTPQAVGLPGDAGRRVPGLRREEVAARAAISADYYLRLEQGRGHQPSRSVLIALAAALDLDEFAQEYLFRLWSQMERGRVVAPGASVLTDATRDMMAAVWRHVPAFVVDRNQDVLAANALVTALSPGILVPGNNLAIHTFEGAARASGEDLPFWRGHAASFAAALRYYGDPADIRFEQVVSILSENDLFVELWARHDVQPIASGPLRVHLDPYGWLDFDNHVFEIPGVPGQALITYRWARETSTDAAMADLTARLEREGRPEVS